MRRAATRHFPVLLFVFFLFIFFFKMQSFHSCSDLMTVVSGSWFTENVIAASGTQTDDVPKTSPEVRLQLGKQRLIQLKSDSRPLSRLTKISMRSWIRRVRCALNYNHTLLRKISHKQEESQMGSEPAPRPVVSKQAFIVHCSILQLLSQ